MISVCPQSVKLQAFSTQSNGPFDAGCLATTNLSWLFVIWYFFIWLEKRKIVLHIRIPGENPWGVWEVGGAKIGQYLDIKSEKKQDIWGARIEQCPESFRNLTKTQQIYVDFPQTAYET